MLLIRPLLTSLLFFISSFIFSQDVIMGFGSIDGDNVEVTISNNVDVSGFQFDIIGSNLTNASGGLAASSGFTVSVGGNTVLGFSFTGSVIPAGSNGILTNLNGNFSNDICLDLGTGAISDPSGNAIDVSFGNFDCNGSEPPCDDEDSDGICDDVDDCVGFFDECGICNGDGPSYECWDGSIACNINECPDQQGGTTLSFGTVGDNVMEIAFDSFTPVAGFQFDITGTQLYNAGGGLAAEAGFTVSVGGNTVIGFSLQGATIQGSGILTNLEYAAVASEACIDNVVLSDPSGNAMDYEVGGCVALDFEGNGCVDVYNIDPIVQCVANVGRLGISQFLFHY